MLLACLVIVLTRWPIRMVDSFSVDEAVSAVIGQEILEGGLPYQAAIDHRGPLTYYLYAGFMAIGGDWNMGAVHTGYLFVLLLIALLLWRMGGRYGGQAALIFAVVSWTQRPMDMWAAHTEWALILGTSLAIWLILTRPESWWRYGLAGVCLGLAALSKQIAVWDGLGIGIWLLLQHLPKKAWKPLLGKGTFLAVGAIIPLLLTGTYFAQAGAWQDFQTYVWHYNVAYYLPEVDLLERIKSSVALLFDFYASSLLLSGLLVGALIKAWQERKKLASRELLFLCWLGGALLGGLTSGRNFGHYAIQWLPASCLLAAWAWQEILQPHLPQRPWQSANPLAWTLGAFLGLGLLLPLGNTLVDQAVYVRYLLNVEPQPGAYVQAHTHAEDRIFVWGFAPEIYVQAQRRPASRFIYCNVLTGLIPWENLERERTDYAILPGVWDQLMADLKANPPAYVIDTSPADINHYGKYPISQYPQLQDWLSQEYELDEEYVKEFPQERVQLYRRK